MIETTAHSMISQSMNAMQTGNIANKTAPVSNASENAPKNMEKVKAAAKDFEAMFMSQMLTHMFSGVKTDETFGGGKGEEVFRGMMVNEYGKMIANAGGIGLSDEISRAMILMQESQ